VVTLDCQTGHLVLGVCSVRTGKVFGPGMGDEMGCRSNTLIVSSH
jgi:hypothetical protein